MKTMSSTRKSHIERYKNNTSKYTKAYKIMSVIFAVTAILSVVQLFAWDSNSLSYFIFEVFSPIISLAYLVITILDIKGRLKNGTPELKL